MSETLESLLARHGPSMLPFLARNAGPLLRFETAEDLLQGLQVRALERGAEFIYQGEKQFFAWLHALARDHIRDRRRYWSAMKRGPARLLRLTDAASATTDPAAVREPAVRRTGPSTFASRREQLALAVKALAALLPRDRDLVSFHAEGLTIQETADRLGLSYDAAERARARALERFRKAFRLIEGGGGAAP